jgi:hypothetical protein
MSNPSTSDINTNIESATESTETVEATESLESFDTIL